ncbi:MAG: triphosphoribosyl-dephospho-CoA synthase CitG [Clostridia bacterium]|nr:triphosphoribosyl-dephospho-CoA synthase CitG [Clostridia bacterium]
MEVTVLDMMNARDRRAEKQRELLSRYGETLLCFTMNIPGPEKDNPLFREGFRLGCRRLRRGFLRLGTAPLFQEEKIYFTGCEAYYVLPLPALEVKKMAADIEEADAVGRLFDLDVLRPDGSKVERQEIGLGGRRCLICGNSAQACARSRTHSVAELRQKTDSILLEAVRADRQETVARLACRALQYEVLTTPKPGLVDRVNSGSHRDMDVFTFAASIVALSPYFAKCAGLGMKMSGEEAPALFEALRLPGRIAEGEMLEATGGVNTHKGAVFSLGILCAAAGRLERADWQADKLLNTAAAMTRGLTEGDLNGLTRENAKTFGQKLYLEHGIRGVRGEAEQGFPLVREYGYPALKSALAQGYSMNDAGCAALIALMAHNTDTNIIHRGGMDALKEVMREAAALLEKESVPSADALEAFDRELISKNISPGGSADLLALCYLLYGLEEEKA